MYSTSKSEDRETCSVLEQVAILREQREYAKAESLILKHIDTESEQEEYVQILMQLQFMRLDLVQTLMTQMVGILYKDKLQVAAN